MRRQRYSSHKTWDTYESDFKLSSSITWFGIQHCSAPGIYTPSPTPLRKPLSGDKSIHSYVITPHQVTCSHTDACINMVLVFDENHMCKHTVAIQTRMKPIIGLHLSHDDPALIYYKPIDRVKFVCFRTLDLSRRANSKVCQ